MSVISTSFRSRSESIVDSWDDTELADLPEWVSSGFGPFESFVLDFLLGGGEFHDSRARPENHAFILLLFGLVWLNDIMHATI